MAIEGTEPKPIGSYPDSGIDVLIVGTGLAGLTASLECLRKSHKVRVLERSSYINTQGMSWISQQAYKAFNSRVGSIAVISCETRGGNKVQSTLACS